MSTLMLDLFPPRPFVNVHDFPLGTAANLQGRRWTANGVGLRRDGRYVLPVMGEIHYARLPRSAWRDALLRMKAGGITVIASYVFWIHHEEEHGRLDFSGDRDLRAFVELCGDIGLPCVVRCGPWCHGEVRNGGLPEWVIDRHAKTKTLRTDDPAYLADVARWYAAIAGQLRGLLWKDGGPVIGVQIENEYGGQAQHLVTLKRLAIDAGLDVPFYTRTGWPELKGAMPFGELLPLFGGYAEGFWDRELVTMPWRYRSEFVFKTIRTDAAIASEHFGDQIAQDAPDTHQYPYLTCEIGAGMMCSYHRRITVFAQDALALAIVKLGSGSNLPGYYMYHGGTNPVGVEPNLNEHQATRYTNYNDLPTKSYDFQTAVGEFGQVREQYHLLRPLHLFLADFGERLAPMATALPTASNDALRYGVRSDGDSGFVFVNNYQRLQPMPAKPGVQFEFGLRGGPLRFPQSPVTVAADRSFVWPFNLDLGNGATLVYATAQLVCDLDDGDVRYVVFVTTDNPAEFAFSGDGVTIDADGDHHAADGRTVLTAVRPGRSPVATLTGVDGRRTCVLLLDDADARRLWKGDAFGRSRLVLTDANVIFDGDTLRLSPTSDAAETTVYMLPPSPQLRAGDSVIQGQEDGVFTAYRVPTPAAPPVAVTVRQTRQAGPPRAIAMGVAGVAAAPTDADFEAAAEWLITLPPGTPTADALLRIRYEGDVARAYCGGRLVTDNFYNGTPFDVGLGHLGEAVGQEGITFRILPLRAGAPIYMLDDVKPEFSGAASVVRVSDVQTVMTRTVIVSS